MKSIEIVKGFYQSDLANDSNLVERFFHEDCELHWTNSQGFQLLRFTDLVQFFEAIRKSYSSLRFEFTHLIEVRESVIILLIDEGIPNRGHRMTLLKPEWKYVACYKIGTVGSFPNYWVQKFGS